MMGADGKQSDNLIPDMRKMLLSGLTLAASALSVQATGTPQTEYLNRGVVAVKTSNGVFVSWRSLISDDPSTTFDVYRDGEKINPAPMANGTNCNDRNGTIDSRYTIKAMVNGVETGTSEEATVIPDAYLRIKLDRPAGGKTPKGESYTYTPNDCSVGDVDADGQYEIFVKWDPSNSHDNSENGYTGNVYIDCYRLDGTKLWRIDLGQNIRAGAHYTQFMVYDFDGDGKAEIACKTAPGTIDGNGTPVLMGDDKVTDDYRGTSGSHTTGVILSGPEYLTMFNGSTGAQISTVAYEPGRGAHSQSSGGWGDSYGNRSERYLACVAYLDGVKPSLVMCRGYYTHSYLCAWDFDGKQLKKRWLHSSTTKGEGAYGEGAHSLTVGDVDGDGCDEIVYGSCCINNDGSLLYRTGAGHGDALHLGDFDPDREGLEVFMVHEETSKSYKYDSEFRDARTGAIIWSTSQSGNDIGRGLVGDISADYRGYEVWPQSYYVGGENVNAVFDCKGNLLVNKRPSTNFRIYWDGDLLDELFDGSYDKATGKYNPEITKRASGLTSNAQTWTFNQYNAQACNTTKATPCLQADILGDWREELLLWDGENSSDLMLFTTTIASAYRVPCLMQDHNYRMAIAWQNVGYNQPPHLGFYLADRYSTDAEIAVTSGELTQNVEVGYSIAPISGTWKRATKVTASSLPAGVTLTCDTEAQTWTIAGKPEKTGTYRFKVTTSGGKTTASVNGVITVGEPVVLEKIAHYSFDDDNAQGTNHVEGTATVYGSPRGTVGKTGRAIVLNGTTDYLTQEAYDRMQLGNTDFTIEMWFRSQDDAAYLFHKGSMAKDATAGTSGNWVGIEYKNGNLKFAIDDDATKSEASVNATAWFDAKWHHLVCVRESSTKSLKIYLDGELQASATDNTGSIIDNNELIVIGNVNNDFNNLFNGMIDELVIYSGAMPATRVAERFAADGKEESGIVGTEADQSVLPTALTLIDATTGIVVATGYGEPSNVTDGAPAGVYLLVTVRGNHRETSKITIR